MFGVELANVPEEKVDLVRGIYDFPALPGPTMVAVKVSDMLGDEILIALAFD